MRSVGLAVATLGAASTGYGQAGQIGVNFVGGDDNFEQDASSVLPDDVAGFVAHGNWNNVAPWTNGMSKGNGQEPDETGTALNLIDSSGSSTTLDISWFAENTFAAQNPLIDTGHERMMDGYLDSSEDKPEIDINLSEIPYASYDVYVYFGSDGNGRSGSIRLNNDPALERFYTTASGIGIFTGATDYLEATATEVNFAGPSNFAVFEGVQGSELLVQAVRGSTNSGIHGLQIIQRIAPAVLRVNVRTGSVTLSGGDIIEIDVNGVEFASAEGSLRPDRYESLGSQQIGIDGDPGDSPGENWEFILNGPDNIQEGFLLGSVGLDTADTIHLGRLYDDARDPADPDHTLEFRYSLTTGQTREGMVEFFDPGLPGDFNDDGVVDGADYTLLRNSFGHDDSILLGRGDGKPGVDDGDYAIWADFYGATESPGESAGVPEPHTLSLLSIVALSLKPRRR